MAIQDAGSISEEIFKAKAPYLIPAEGILGRNVLGHGHTIRSTKLHRRIKSEKVPFPTRSTQTPPSPYDARTGIPKNSSHYSKHRIAVKIEVLRNGLIRSGIKGKSGDFARAAVEFPAKTFMNSSPKGRSLIAKKMSQRAARRQPADSSRTATATQNH